MRAPRFLNRLAPLWTPPPPSAGLPARSPLEEKVGVALAAFATFVVGFVGFWGINGIFADGHFATVAGIGIGGVNMATHASPWAHFTFEPSNQPLLASNAYMHHPLGIFWTAGVMAKIFGAHNWVPRFPAVAIVILTSIFLYRLGRAIWGPLEGGLAALAYAALPITLGFANFHDLEQPLMLGTVVASWGYARFRQTARERYVLLSVAGFAFAILTDWEAYVWGAAFLGFLFARAFVIPERWLGPVPSRAMGRYWAIMCGTAVVFLAFELGLVLYTGRLNDLLGSYESRTAGSAMPLNLVLQARHVRIELMFPGLAIAVGKLALPVIVARFFVRRDELELLPLFLWIMAIVYYVMFKQGADTHIFWPHPFATYLGLGVGALVASLRELQPWLARRLDGRAPAWLRRPGAAPFIAAGIVALPVLLIMRDGFSMVRPARETGGRFMEIFIESNVDRNTALEWFVSRFPTTEPVAFHASSPPGFDAQWTVRPRVTQARQPVGYTPGAPGRMYVLDAKNTAVAELRDVATRYHVHAVGSHWFMNRAEPAAPLDGYSFGEHEPNPFESFSQGPTEPIRRVTPDPWSTWEWRTLLGQKAMPPTGQPRTREELRIAHNLALSRGDAAAAARYRQQLVGGLELPVTAKWSTGTELLGVAHDTGAARRLTMYVIPGPTHGQPKFVVRAKVLGRRFLSTLPVDPAETDIAYLPPITADLWKVGYIYAVPVVYRHRAGHEQFTLTLVPYGGKPTPIRVGGPQVIPLLTL